MVQACVIVCREPNGGRKSGISSVCDKVHEHRSVRFYSVGFLMRLKQNT